MTSATGRCHTFDERADGYARGEACCAASLRREDEAASLLARGSAVRQDGRSASLTAPNGLAQQGLLRASLEDACMAASDLSCAEAHGTGTALGDPIEAGSLASTVLMPIGGSSSVGLGSGKANVGHAEPAAGATGMLKLALQLQHALIAPNAHLRLLNPHVGSAIGGLSCALSQQAQSSVAAVGAAGGVSSFGYSGSLCHIALEARVPSIVLAPRPLSLGRRRRFAWTSVATREDTFTVGGRNAASLAVQSNLDAAVASLHLPASYLLQSQLPLLAPVLVYQLRQSRSER